mmetsp:Transcript_3303/g.2257  ORF Transcript_3303/g.2257 Transcript_3303/m.2257 type:complete len:155 (+) Transcript_3303:643-1107(+)
MTFDEGFLQKNPYDHVIHCSGYSFATGFMQGLEDCLNSKGQIMVNRHMQVTNVNPLLPGRDLSKTHTPRTLKNVFCVGDVCQTALNEEKSIYPLKEMASIAAHNIKALANGQQNLLALPEQMGRIYAITLGPENGMLIINDFVSVGRNAANTKV